MLSWRSSDPQKILGSTGLKSPAQGRWTNENGGHDAKAGAFGRPPPLNVDNGQRCGGKGYHLGEVAVGQVPTSKLSRYSYGTARLENC